MDEKYELTLYEITAAKRMIKYVHLIYLINGLSLFFILGLFYKRIDILNHSLILFLSCMAIINTINIADTIIRKIIVYDLIYQKSYTNKSYIQLSKDEYRNVLYSIKEFIIAPFLYPTIITFSLMLFMCILKEYECFNITDENVLLYSILAHMAFILINKIKWKDSMITSMQRYKKLKEEFIGE